MSCRVRPPSIPTAGAPSAPPGTASPSRRGRRWNYAYGCVPQGPARTPATALGPDFERVVTTRRAEADEFYAALTPAAASSDEAMVMRQAFAGMLWSKQLYYYNVARWLDGDEGQPLPPASRRTGRNARWRSFDAFDVMSMPDKWEYPWFVAWDLAFHCVALAHVDPAFTKQQLLLVCREWFQHPNGALPAYEWDFGDVNPPVQAWAALEVFAIDGGRDLDLLSRVFDKLLVNFTWWVNREDAEGSNLFEGGFLGLDNIGPLDRSHLPVGGVLEQADATGWMATYSLAMTTIAAILHRSGRRPAPDLVEKFLEHFAGIHRRRRCQAGRAGRGGREPLDPGLRRAGDRTPRNSPIRTVTRAAGVSATGSSPNPLRSMLRRTGMAHVRDAALLSRPSGEAAWPRLRKLARPRHLSSQ
jgi:hypothetical protein